MKADAGNNVDGIRTKNNMSPILRVGAGDRNCQFVGVSDTKVEND